DHLQLPPPRRRPPAPPTLRRRTEGSDREARAVHDQSVQRLQDGAGERAAVGDDLVASRAGVLAGRMGGVPPPRYTSVVMDNELKHYSDNLNERIDNLSGRCDGLSGR